ncbi:MAG: DNA sulfur modification protein DndB [Bacillus sp. (in: firmicutes)]
MISLPLKKLIESVNQGTITIRETNQAHVRRIKDYILENAADDDIYFPPMVATLSDSEIKLENPVHFTIIDGSHRVKAIVQLEDVIQKAIKNEQPDTIKKGYKLSHIIDHTSIAIQLIGGLCTEEINQLYIDLNTKGKKVPLSKRISYDSRSILNRITNVILASNEKLKIAGVEMEKRSMIRPANRKLLSLSQLRQLVDFFVYGGMVQNQQRAQAFRRLEESEYIELVNAWLDALFAMHPAESIGNDHESIFANFPVLMAMALYVNNNQLQEPFNRRKAELLIRMKEIEHIDWNRNHEMWMRFEGGRRGKQQYYYISNKKPVLKEIVAWLESERR